MKLDAIRVQMNKLMSPDGPLMASQRELLPNQGQGEYPTYRVNTR